MKKISKNKNDQTINRRQLIHNGFRLSLFTGSVLATSMLRIPVVNADETVCVDPEDLSGGELSLRRSLGYIDKAPTEKNNCGTCGFFDAEADKGCGNCKILNGPVETNAWCESWSERN